MVIKQHCRACACTLDMTAAVFVYGCVLDEHEVHLAHLIISNSTHGLPLPCVRACCGCCRHWLPVVQSKLRREVDATSREITLAADAAEKRWARAGSELIHKPPARPVPPVAAGLKRRRAAAEAAAAATPAEPLTPEQEEAETDDLVAKIMSGTLWPTYRGQAAAAAQPAAAAAAQ